MAETQKGSTTRRKKKKSSTKAENETGGHTARERPSRPTFEARSAGLLQDFANNASEIVEKSATILQEEIAAGIQAARAVEAKFLDVEALRGGSKDRFSRRVRRDVHDVIDIVVDLVEAGVKGAGGMALRTIRIRPGGADEERRPVPGNIPTLSAPAPLKPGESTEIDMLLENSSEEETEEFVFFSSDLINAASGDRISADRVGVSPSPVVISPRDTANATVRISVPDDTRHGLYSGLLQATRLDKLRAIISIQVG